MCNCPGAAQSLGSDRFLVLSTSYMTAQTVPQHAQAPKWGGRGVLGVRPGPHPLVCLFFFGEIDNSKQTDDTDIFQSSSLHKFSDSTVRIWFSLLYLGGGGGLFKLRILVVSPSVLEWFKSYLK